MSRSVLTPELHTELEALATGVGCELVHVAFHENVLRVMLDHPEGVTHDHCTQVSRQLSALLDVDDFGTRRYVLEVTSPGLDRPLYRPADWQRFVGSLVRVTFYDREQGGETKRTVVARLMAFDEADGGGARVAEEPAGQEWSFALTDVERARLEIEL